jgi:hypothetical protein
MLSTMLIAAAVAVTGATVVAAGGSQEPERPRNTPSPSVQAAPPLRPGVPEQPTAVQDRQSELLMRALEARLTAQKALVTAQPAPRIVCGMKMIEVDPKTDPKILLPPAASDVDPKIRISSPAACRE